MPKTFNWLITLLLATGIILTACGSDDKKSSKSQLDSPNEPNALPLPGTTQAPLVAPTYPPTWTASPAVRTRVPEATRPAARTAYPTPNPDDRTPEPLETYVVPSEWFDLPFTDEDGNTRTISEFLGRGMVIQTMSAGCDFCMEQQQYLVDAIQNRIEMGVLPDTVFLILSVNQNETPSVVKSVLQNQLGEEKWAVVETLYEEDTAADWIVGVASRELVEALETAFARPISDMENQAVIVVEPDGLAHQTAEGIVDTNNLLLAISFYGNQLFSE